MANLESTQSSADVLAEDLEPESPGEGNVDQPKPLTDEVFAGEDAAEESGNDVMDVQSDDHVDQSDDMALADPDQGVGKRVKVYELREQAWFDRGTGRCKGIYDDTNDLALLSVEPERQEDEVEGGGFLPDGLLLHTTVSKEETYTRQQDTLIVWTDRATQLDIALSFQDPEGCEDIWQFIMEVQKHLNNQIGEEPKLALGSSSPLAAASPLINCSASAMGAMARDPWQPPSLANIKEHEMWLRMQAKSPAGHERAVEHIIGEDYIKQLIGVLNQAEDLESINDLHALCSLMQTILMFNDNGIFEYILQDDIYMGVLGMLEYDPEFPTLKASYRSFFRQFSKFRQVVEIKDENVRNKIHQLSRLLYLKDVVLARMLDDPTFGILNSFVFFNQVDITTYIQSDDVLLHELFIDFREDDNEAKAPKKRDLVLFLHQLMLMGKGVQVQNRLQLYRMLLDRGLLLACEWAFRQPEATILHAGAEILTLAVEHDANAVRLHALREEEMSRRTLVMEMIGLLQTTQDQGLVQQLIESLKTLLEPGAENETLARAKDTTVIESFTQYFYDLCASQLFAPLDELPELKEATPPTLPIDRVSLIGVLVDILSYCVVVHAHRAQYYILSNPLAQKVCSLLYAREKTLRHAALRLIKACLRTNNHFVHRNFAKNGMTKAILDLVERETGRDTMLSSACLDTLEMIRKDNMKGIIVDMFERYESTMARLAERPYVRSYMMGLRLRWDQYKEPPPRPATAVEANQTRSAADEEEAWFNRSDEEAESSSLLPVKRKRAAGSSAKRSEGAALGLDYDDASDSEGEGDSKGNQLAEGLTDVELKIRAKRLREEEDEGLVVRAASKKVEATAEQGGKEKKIRLSFAGLGKKLSGGGKA